MALSYACESAVTVDQVELAGCGCDLTDLMVPLQDLIDAATDAIYLLSGGQIGGRCETTVRPCSQGYCYCGMWPCQCCDIPGITLTGHLPEVTAVKIDGVTLDPAEYRMVNGRKLVRADGTLWPGGKNPLLSDSEDNTFSITYLYGISFGPLAQRAAIELVCEMAKTLTSGQTRLPEGTMAATADGVSVQISRLPGQAELEAVGLTWLGRFLSLYGNASMVTQVRSPELEEGWVLNVVDTL